MPKCKTKTARVTGADTTAYWEARLKRAGLSMEAGRSELISYGFTLKDLDFDGRNVRPTTADLERDEWPVSL
jgi:hypothetical protein